MKTGILYIVATPIGNLSDITLRALDILKEADMIAAEDTRHSIKLLNHYDIKNKLISYHEFSDQKKEDELLGYLAEGRTIALISDAGTPLVSDPGSGLVKRAIEQGVTVTPIPGPSALITALSVSGLLEGAFRFEGFLPAKATQRKQKLEMLEASDVPVVFYEAPHRIVSLLKAMSSVFGEARQIVLARELTKVHEEIIRGSIADVLSQIEANPIKGEIVVIADKKTAEAAEVTDEAIIASLNRFIEKGATKKDAVKQTASALHTCKNRVYQLSVKL